MIAPCARTSALKLARQDVRVFPCKNLPGHDDDKKPLTKNGFKDASTSPDVVHKWWTRWPDALIGTPTGDAFVVIDADLEHEDAQRWLADNRVRLPLTRTHRTRSGGMHFLFAPNEKVKCTATRLGPHIDTRGLGGYIVWWPACGFEVLYGEVLAPVPDWVTEALRSPEAPPHSVVQLPMHVSAHRKFEGIVKTIAGAREGQRNSLAFWGACRMRELVAQDAIGRDAAIEIVVEAASRAGLPRNEARRTAQSAFRSG
jgi:Bifunctional DNA primase/polymerase, N-terminal